MITIDINKLLEEGFSQSEMTAWDECPEAWYRGYAERLYLPGQISWPLLYGDAAHKNIEYFHREGHRPKEIVMLQIPNDMEGMLSAEQEAELQHWNAVLSAQMERYFIHYADDAETLELLLEGTEQVLETVFHGIRLRGKIDMMMKRSTNFGIMDTKTTSRYSPDILNGWYYKFQFMFYPWLTWRALGKKISEFGVDVIVKPALRLKQNESVESFHARIKADMIQEPDKYFKRIWLPLVKGSLEVFEETLLKPKLNRIKALTNVTQPDILNLLTRNRNTNNCSRIGRTCQFLPLCQNGESERFRYRAKEYKHTELDTQTFE